MVYNRNRGNQIGEDRKEIKDSIMNRSISTVTLFVVYKVMQLQK